MVDLLIAMGIIGCALYVLCQIVHFYRSCWNDWVKAKRKIDEEYHD